MDGGIKYSFEINGDYPLILELHLVIGADQAQTTRRIYNGKINWEPMDNYYMTENAKRYAQKLVDNMVFI